MLSGRARVLQVLRDGAATSVVAQMEATNAVLKFVVGGWRAAANARKPEKGGSQPGKSRPGEAGPCESEASEPASANALKPGHTVLLRLLACAPPVLTVEVEPVEGAGGVQPAASEAAAEPARKRQFLGRLP